MSVLTRAQREFLSRFFERENARAFYLTGGGALTEFYLQHRLSEDIDLFTQNRSAWESIRDDLQIAAVGGGLMLEFRESKSENEMHRAFLQVPGEQNLKIDIVRDAPPHFGEVNVQSDGVVVDSLENIAVGKLLALYGRAYPRDFVDVYFLLRSGLQLEHLLELGKKKDPGLLEFYLAGMVRQIVNVQIKHLPEMLKPIDFDDMQRFFLKLADDLMASQNPDRLAG